MGSGKAKLEIPQKHPKVLNLVGELPLSETMALIERADGGSY
jgi:ADP-heptose:LPS heptosyltransferase